MWTAGIPPSPRFGLGKRGHLPEALHLQGHGLGQATHRHRVDKERDARSGDPPDIVRRTPLLLTFGSPLDNTAFIFAQQGSNTSEAREALAASVQPLLQSYALQPARWKSVYSPWDIISGHLGFYDLPANAVQPQAAVNVKDPEPTTLLIAHTEYWRSDFVLQELYAAL